jgi:DNA-binding CsgD family transcriptional regulator
MRILVTEDGWLECRAELAKRGITLELRDRATFEKGIDGLLVPVTAWPIAPSRKHYAPVVLYGRTEEVGELRDEPSVTVLETDGLLTPVEAAEAVKAAFSARTRLPFVRGAPRSEPPPPTRSTARVKQGAEDLFDRAKLSDRQRETMRFAVNGLSREDTAKRMGVSEATVRTQRTLALQRLGVRDVRELQAKLLK